MKSIIIVLVLAGVNLCSTWSLQNQIPLFVVPENGNRGCRTQQKQDNALQTIRECVLTTLTLQPKLECGAGDWTRVAYLNMSNPSQSCPSAWRDRSANGVRVCG